MENNSASGAKFVFDKKDTAIDEQKEVQVTSPVEERVVEQPKVDDAYEDLDAEYTDIRSITISLVKNHSLYRKANDKVLPRRIDFIGSSVNSSRILSSNKTEMETYLPSLIGVSVNDPSFVLRVKQYFNNIRIPVDELGRTFNIGFIYNKKKDYLRIKAEEDRIEEEYSRIDRRDTIKIKEALKLKITKLNALESSKCLLGRPLNVEDYLMYRHCLLYNDIAKDLALINIDKNVRFFVKDDQKETDKMRKYRIEVNKAKTNYVACLADNSLFNAVYIQFCVLKGMPIIASLAEDQIEKEVKLDIFSAEEPVKFNKIYTNKDVRLIGKIEMLIARGELHRSDYNQNITTADGDFVGSNMGEAVAYFKSPDNSQIVAAYDNILRNM